MQTGGYIQKIDFSSNLLDLWQLLFKTGNRIHIDLYFIYCAIANSNNVIAFKSFHDLVE